MTKEEFEKLDMMKRTEVLFDLLNEVLNRLGKKDNPMTPYIPTNPYEQPEVKPWSPHLLNEVLNRLGKKDNPMTPYIPTNPYEQPEVKPWSPPSPVTNPNYPIMKNKCSKCGIELSSVMGYVCSQTDCPTGLNGGNISFKS